MMHKILFGIEFVSTFIIIYMSSHNSSVVAANETEGKDIYFGPHVVVIYPTQKSISTQNFRTLYAYVVLVPSHLGIVHNCYVGAIDGRKLKLQRWGNLYWHEVHAKGHENLYNGSNFIRENGQMGIIFPHKVRLTGQTDVLCTKGLVHYQMDISFVTTCRIGT
jgi:hypothetical protein